MLRVEADIQLINSQIKHGPTGKGQVDGGSLPSEQHHKKDSTLEKIDALLEPSATRQLGAGLGGTTGSMAHELQPSTLARL